MKNQKIISVANKKGGVTKTTTTTALADICASLLNLKVLLIDLDPQCNATKMVQADLGEKSVIDLFKDGRGLYIHELINIIQKTRINNLDVIPGNEGLDEFCDYLLLKYGSLRDDTINIPIVVQCFLQESLSKLINMYDIILIDNTPYFNLITQNALAASNAVLIPIETDGFSFDGLIKLLEKIYKVKSDTNQSLDILGIFASRIKPTRRLFKSLYPSLKEELGAKFLNTYIREDAKAGESSTQFIPIYSYAPNSNITLDYMELLSEINILDEVHQSILNNKIKSIKIKKGVIVNG